MEKLHEFWENLPNWGRVLAVGGVSLVAYGHYSFFTSKKTRKSPIKEDWEKDIVYLYQYPRSRHIPNVSCFCLKLETWLRMSEVPYEITAGFANKSKEGTVPFVELNGKEYYDSAFIIRDLSVVLHRAQLEDHLSDEQRACSRAFEKLAEESLQQSHLIFTAENVDKIIDSLPPNAFGFFSNLIIFIGKKTMARMMQKVLSSTRIGKHSREDRISIGSDDLRAISKYLGAKHYFTGFKPTRIDVSLFGILAQIVYAPYDSTHLALIRDECPNLLEYVERIKARYWPDWGDATTNFSIDTNWKRRPMLSSPKPPSR